MEPQAKEKKLPLKLSVGSYMCIMHTCISCTQVQQQGIELYFIVCIARIDIAFVYYIEIP